MADLAAGIPVRPVHRRIVFIFQAQTTMNPFRVPSTEIDIRCGSIQRRLQANGIDGLLIIQRVDLFYFSGTAQSGFLYIPADGQPLLCVKRHLPRALEESPLRNIVPIHSVTELPARIIDAHGRLPVVLALELDVLPVKEFRFLRRLFDGCRMVDGSSLVLGVRKVKSTWEIAQIERTAEMSARTFAYMQTVLRPGLSEMEFAGLFETQARRWGHGGKLRTRSYLSEAYPWHVLSGENGGKVGMLDSPFSGEGTSPAFPCGAGDRRIKADEPVLVDFGFVLNGYHMDETRMFVIGKLAEKVLKVCDAAVAIHNRVLDEVKPGVTTGELFEHAVAAAAAAGCSENFLGPPGQKVGFVGHGIGLELVEPPFIAKGKADVLIPGMTLALEPKFCFPGEFAAGIESVFRVAESGYRLVSRVPARVFSC